jgi:hypothetical protein
LGLRQADISGAIIEENKIVARPLVFIKLHVRSDRKRSV